MLTRTSEILKSFGLLSVSCVFFLTTVDTAHTAIIDFETIPTVGFNNTTQLNTDGALVDAAHFGDDNEADVTASGIQFVSRGASSPNLSLVNGTAHTSTLMYQAATHALGFTDIIGMSATDEELMFDGVTFGPGLQNSLTTIVGGLTLGHEYLFQLVVVDDRGSTNNTFVSNEPAGGVFYGPFDWSQNAVQLITGTFTADSVTQSFRHYVGGNNNAQINAFQLRDLTVPEPSAVTLVVIGILSMCIRRPRRSVMR